MIDINKIAGLIAAQLLTDHGIKAEPTPFDAGKGRDGDEYFCLKVEQNLGIFSSVVKDALLSLRVGEFKIKDENQTSVMASLNYRHHGGGQNGSNIGTYWFDDDGKLIGQRAG